MHGQHGLAVGAEEHQIGFPMPWGLAVSGGGRPLIQGAPEVDKGGGTAAPAAPPAPFPLGTGEVVAPGAARFSAGGLGVDEAVDGLMGNDRRAPLQPEPAGDLLRRPALFEPGKHLGPQGGIPVEAGAAPAAGAGLLLSIAGLVALLAGGIALQLARNGRWRAIQSCSDLPERAPRGV